MARAWGPPPDSPATANFLMSRASASCSMSLPQSGRVRSGAGEERPYPGRSGRMSLRPLMFASSSVW